LPNKTEEVKKAAWSLASFVFFGQPAWGNFPRLARILQDRSTRHQPDWWFGICVHLRNLRLNPPPASWAAALSRGSVGLFWHSGSCLSRRLFTPFIGQEDSGQEDSGCRGLKIFLPLIFLPMAWWLLPILSQGILPTDNPDIANEG
jgi:hypothetical protein